MRSRLAAHSEISRAHFGGQLVLFRVLRHGAGWWFMVTNSSVDNLEWENALIGKRGLLVHQQEALAGDDCIADSFKLDYGPC